MGTISTTITQEVTLAASGVYSSPLTITNSGALEVAAAAAIYGPGTQAWSVYNAGMVTNSDTTGAGIVLDDGGAVANSAGGTITAYEGVITRGAAGSVTNAGYIQGTGLGTLSIGVYLEAGGSVTNQAGGTIAGGNRGVAGATNITNYGTIVGTIWSGIDLGSSGTITNAQGALITGTRAIRSGATLVANAGTILGTNGVGVGLIGTNGLITNSGLIEGLDSNAIAFAVDGTVVNGSSVSTTGLIEGREGIDIPNAGTVINFGTITGTAVGGIWIRGSGIVFNGGSGATDQSISGSGFGIRIEGAGIVDNGDAGATGQSITGGNYAIFVESGIGTVRNFGTLAASPTSSESTGLWLASGGDVFNGAGASTGWLITGQRYGIDGATNVSNYGTIAGVVFAGIVGGSGGTISNAQVGLITGGAKGVSGGTKLVSNAGTIIGKYGYALYLSGTAGNTVTNVGTISGNSDGVYLTAGGTVTNQSGGSIAATSHHGVSIRGGDGTVTNAGAIIGGTSGAAVRFVGSFTDRLVVDPGAVFTGNVVGGSGSNTLELAQGGGSSGTISGLGTQFTNFGTAAVDAGASWVFSANDTIASSGSLEIGVGATVTGTIAFGSGSDLKIDGANLATDPSLAIGATLAGLAPGDSIDLTGIAYVGGTAVVNASNVLQVSEDGQTYDLQLDQPYAGHTFGLFPDGSDGTAIYEDGVACFCRGTLIRTDQGEVAVEALAIGDRVITLSGAARPIKWIGKRAYDPRFVAGNRNVLPVRIEAGALASGIPARDLWVSPEHAMYLGQVLVPAQLLVNDATITQPESVERLEYFHLDLGVHDVILAEGTAAESYVDCDNRGLFHNAREFARRYPGETPPRWEFCARRVEEGSPELAAIRHGVLARARSFDRFTDDPDLHLAVDGTPIRAQLGANRRLYRFTVPAGGRSIALASRSSIPTKVDISPADGRRLGVAVERIMLRGAGLTVEIEPECPALCNGFHAAEPGHRWTDGRGHLPAGLLAAFGGEFVVDVHLAETDLVYGLETRAAAARSRATLGRMSRA